LLSRVKRLLSWVSAEAVRLLGVKPESDGEVIVDERLHGLLTQALAEYNDSGSLARIERLLVMARPADLDAGEITDKGYVNQRKVLACRSALVAMLYADQVPPGVVVAGSTRAGPPRRVAVRDGPGRWDRGRGESTA
jgi:feruloyl-CoA synthase